METAENFFVELCGKVLLIFRNIKNMCNVLLGFFLLFSLMNLFPAKPKYGQCCFK